MLTRSGLTLSEVSLMVSLGFLCQPVCSFLVLSVMYYGAFSLRDATNLK